MDNFDYAAHITFMMYNGDLIPWHIVFTYVHPPFNSYIIGLNAENILFSYKDLSYNWNVDNFPRSDSLFLDVSAEPSGMKNAILSFYNNVLQTQNTDTWDIIIGAVDHDTYLYLKDILPNTILLKSHLKSHDLTLATVYRKYENDKIWQTA